MSSFTDRLYRTATSTARGMVTGEPSAPSRRTWGDVHQLARRMAGALASHVEPGGRVAVLMEDPADIAPVVQAIWMRGAAFTMLQLPTARTDLGQWVAATAGVLAMIDADVLIVGSSFDTALAEGGLPVPVVHVGHLASGPAAEPAAPAEDDAALLQLSSGSTGDPKAIVITHRNLYANITAMMERSGLTTAADEVMISWLPLSHDMGMITFLAMPMLAGVELVSITAADFLRDPLLWAQLISRYRGTFTGAPNFAYALLGNRLDRVADDRAYDLSSMQVAVNGAEPIDCAAMDTFTRQAARFGWPETALAPCYGLAEAVVAVSTPDRGSGLRVDHVDRRVLEGEGIAAPLATGVAYAELGKPLAGIEIRVVDPTTGVARGTRQVGEFELRGDSMTSEYLTARGSRAAQDAEGWLRTGDLGYLTEGGEPVICGRRKDVIIISGRNLYPTDIERAVERVEGVRVGNSVAVSLGAGGAGEGFAVLAESDSHADESRALQLRRAISMEVFRAVGIPPRSVAILAPGALPKTTSGKLRRSSARAIVTAAG
ncbi:fatty acyl-AMP ligase [Nocardia sp. NPDC050712]|uniref:fatty acyl-AMP ligase n=1 Tax=Nocardia sp. NPDC050712 TaxID=3155518 RepID=UPI0033F1B31D